MSRYTTEQLRWMARKVQAAATSDPMTYTMFLATVATLTGLTAEAVRYKIERYAEGKK